MRIELYLLERERLVIKFIVRVLNGRVFSSDIGFVAS